MATDFSKLIFPALDTFQIEIPSWGFANTGTRFGKFIQSGAATNLEEKFSDGGQVHSLTGVCPTLALHVSWDFPAGLGSVVQVAALANRYGIRPGAINPNLFQEQNYKFGSFCNPDPIVREQALRHARESIAIARQLNCRDVSFWLADGSNYPGTAHIRNRRKYMTDAFQACHAELDHNQRLLIEYKPFEPAFYHTDIADWGMAVLLARASGEKAKVLVDTGHHYQAQNIEQIVAWLLEENRLGGFHFNDRRYADDDLTLGSIDPYQVFRIFHEILFFEWERGMRADIAFMIDQSHNLKPKLEATIQTVTMAQSLYAKATLVDHAGLAAAQQKCDLVQAEMFLQDAFSTDVRPVIHEWRTSKGLPVEPLETYRQSGHAERIMADRAERNRANLTSYA